MKKRKVIDIQIQKRRKNRRSIFLDDGSVFGISEDVFFSIPLHIGDNISDQVFNDILQADSNTKIYNSAIRLLTFRMRSTTEMKDRLKRKKYNEDVIMNVIKNLEIKGYLDDEKFAYAFAKDKVKNKLIGPIALRYEMSPHNLDADLLDKTISSTYDMYPPKQLINRLINKWKAKDRIKTDSKIKIKIINRLKNKGFFWDDIQQVINTL